MSRQTASLEHNEQGTVVQDARPQGSVLDIVLVLTRYSHVIFKVAGSIIVVSIIVALLIPNSYTATERLLPPKQNQSMASMLLGQLGSFASTAADTLGIHDPNDMYVAMLKSDTISLRLIKQFDLQKVYKSKTETDAILKLRKNSDITAGQDSIISIAVTDRDPALAAAIAAGYGDNLRRLMEELNSDSASQRRTYYETQLAKAKEQLSAAEASLKGTQERTGLIDLNEQAKAIIGSVALMRAKVTATEVQLEGMRSYATPNNPDLIRLERLLQAEKAQLAKSEENEALGAGNIQVPTGKVPAVGMEYVRRYRDVKYYETLYELVAKQYEMARLDEASTVSSVQELDRARKPEKKSKPQRALIVLLSAIFGIFLGIACAFGCDAWESMKMDPDSAEKLAMIRHAASSFRWRGPKAN